MPLSINTNIASLSAQRSLSESNAKLDTAFERLATGNRINQATDDAAGLSIAIKMESRVSGMNQAMRNINDGVSMVQIAEGALDEATSILQRMRDISVQAANSSLGAAELGYLDTEATTLAAALDDVFGAAKFNGDALINLDGTDNAQTIQIGAGTSSTLDQMTFTIDGLSAIALGVTDGDIVLGATSGGAAEVVNFDISIADTPAESDTYTLTVGGLTVAAASAGAEFDSYADIAAALNAVTLGDASMTLGDLGYIVAGTAGGITVTATANGVKADDNISLTSNTGTVGSARVTTQGSATTTSGGAAAISTIDLALAAVAEDRAYLGATQAQLESVQRNLANVAENTSSAVGRIMDTDYAAETANLTKAQILQQAATSILAQANAQPQAILSLLQ